MLSRPLLELRELASPSGQQLQVELDKKDNLIIRIAGIQHESEKLRSSRLSFITLKVQHRD